jgi:tRNA (mo5U34)-methyltransferase
MPRSDEQFMTQAPEPPAGFDPERAFAGVHWHQSWEVFRGITTPGRNSVSRLCRRVRLPADLAGKRVLDIGAWNGGYSFECERRGAGEVVAYSLENPDVTGFNRLKALLGSRVRYVQGSVYTLSPEQMGEFDLILFFGVLYHLRYPLLAMDRIRSVSCGDVLIETHTLTSWHLLRAPFWLFGALFGLAAIFRGTPLWRQYKEYELHPEDQSNWFGPNIKAVVESFETAGFSVQHLASWDWGTRSAFRAVAAPMPSRMRDGTYEGLSTFNAHLTGIDRRDGELFRRDDTKERVGTA